MTFFVFFPVFRYKFFMLQQEVKHIGIKYQKLFELLTKLMAFDALITFLISWKVKLDLFRIPLKLSALPMFLNLPAFRNEGVSREIDYVIDATEFEAAFDCPPEDTPSTFEGRKGIPKVDEAGGRFRRVGQ